MAGKVFPSYVQYGTVLLKSVGFAGQSYGIFPRPGIPVQGDVILAKKEYVRLLDGSKSFHAPADFLNTISRCDFHDVVEPSAWDRLSAD